MIWDNRFNWFQANIYLTRIAVLKRSSENQSKMIAFSQPLIQDQSKVYSIVNDAKCLTQESLNSYRETENSILLNDIEMKNLPIKFESILSIEDQNMYRLLS